MPTFRILGLGLSVLTLLAARPAAAQLTKKRGAEPPPAKALSPSEQYAKDAAELATQRAESFKCHCSVPEAERAASGCKQCFGGEICVLPDPGDLWPPLVQHKFSNDCYGKKEAPRVLAELRADTAKFEAMWAPVAKRQKEVTAAIARARELAQAGKLADAKQALYAVVTAAEVDDEGQVPCAQRTEKGINPGPMDAELPALRELEALAREAKEPWLLLEILSNFRIRRQVLDRESELVLFLHPSWGRSKGTDGFPDLEHCAEGVRFLRDYETELARYGLVAADAVRPGREKVGDSVLYMVPVVLPEWGKTDVSLKGKELRASIFVKGSWRLKHCGQTNEIDGIDSDGRFTYRSECDEEKLPDARGTIAATLAADPPAWFKKDADGRYPWLGIVGTIKKRGPNVVLSDAHIVDVRFLGD